MALDCAKLPAPWQSRSPVMPFQERPATLSNGAHLVAAGMRHDFAMPGGAWHAMRTASRGLAQFIEPAAMRGICSTKRPWETCILQESG